MTVGSEIPLGKDFYRGRRGPIKSENVYSELVCSSMAALSWKLGTTNCLKSLTSIENLHRFSKIFFCTHGSNEKKTEKELSGFAKSFIKQSEINEPAPQESFAALLRKSKFIDLGNAVGKHVIGTIYHVKEDDLYIDFGWKFPTVCLKPKKNQEFYIRGAKVKLLIKDLELSSRFLGGTTDITLCEADCVLLGLAR